MNCSKCKRELILEPGAHLCRCGNFYIVRKRKQQALDSFIKKAGTKTCSECKKQRKIGDFYYHAELEKELCVSCTLLYYQLIQARPEVIDHITELHDIVFTETVGKCSK